MKPARNVIQVTLGEVTDSQAERLTAQTESGVHVTRTGHGTHQVEVWGAMPVGWLANFTRGAARMGLDIARGVAQRNAQRSWSATFEVRASSETTVQSIDFLELARARVESAPPIRLELLGFELTRSVERRGMLELRIEARDRVGFLAALLGHLAGFVLFPEEIRIDTFQSLAEDALLLSSVAGESPPPEIEAVLRNSLRLCTQR